MRISHSIELVLIIYVINCFDIILRTAITWFKIYTKINGICFVWLVTQ